MLLKGHTALPFLARGMLDVPVEASLWKAQIGFGVALTVIVSELCYLLPLSVQHEIIQFVPATI